MATTVFAESPEGVVLAVNGIDPALRWDGYAAGFTAAGVSPPDPTAALLLTFFGAGPITGTYSAFVRFVDAFGNVSNPSQFAPAATAAGAAGVTYTGVPLPTQPTVVRRQILRNTAGQQSTFYVDVDTPDVVGTTFTSTTPDAVLSGNEAQALFDTDGTALFNRYGVPPDTAAVATMHLGRVWYLAITPYGEGSIAVVNNSTFVVGTGAEWRTGFAGRFLHVLGGDAPYEIAACDPIAGTLTLAQPYRGFTDPYAAYSIQPDPTILNNVYFSEAGLAEAVAPTNALAIREDGDRLVTAVPLNSFLYVFKRRSAYRITAQTDPAADGYIFDSVNRGSAGPNSWVKADGIAYMLDEQGVYKFDGHDATAISSPVQDFFRGTNRDGFRINWKNARFFHALHCPKEETVRFFLTINGGYLPRYALCYATKLDRWWLEQYPFPIGASTLGRLGRPTAGWTASPDQPFVGGQGGRVYAYGPDSLDGPQAWQPGYAGVVVGTGPYTITPAAPVGAEAVGAALVVASGRGMGQTRVVVAVRANGDIEVDQPWLVFPAPGDSFGVGGVGYTYRTNYLEYSPNDAQDGFFIQMGFQPQQWGTAVVSTSVDFGPPEAAEEDTQPGEDDGVSARKGDPGLTVALTRKSGWFVTRSDRHRELFTPGARTTAVSFSGVSGPTRHTYYTLLLNGVVGP